MSLVVRRIQLCMNERAVADEQRGRVVRGVAFAEGFEYRAVDGDAEEARGSFRGEGAALSEIGGSDDLVASEDGDQAEMDGGLLGLGTLSLRSRTVPCSQSSPLSLSGGRVLGVR